MAKAPARKTKARPKAKGKAPRKRKVSDAKAGVEEWPLPRRVFFRPERMAYIRKLIPDIGCVFCRAAANEISFETLCVKKTAYSMVVLNKYPYNSGHLLVIPLRHVGDLLELSPDEYMDLHLTLRDAVAAIKSVYEPAALNIGLNHGQAAGAGIPGHLHYHLVPRWAGDLNFFPLIAETKLVIESLETSFERLLGYFKTESKST